MIYHKNSLCICSGRRANTKDWFSFIYPRIIGGGIFLKAYKSFTPSYILQAYMSLPTCSHGAWLVFCRLMYCKIRGWKLNSLLGWRHNIKWNVRNHFQPDVNELILSEIGEYFFKYSTNVRCRETIAAWEPTRNLEVAHQFFFIYLQCNSRWSYEFCTNICRRMGWLALISPTNLVSLHSMSARFFLATRTFHSRALLR